MNISEIITKPGLYKSKALKKGTAIQISPAGVASLVAYRSRTDIVPVEQVLPVYKGLFDITDFEIAENRAELWND